MFFALVPPLLEYASDVWDPHLKKDVDIIERTQRTAARFITGNYRSSTPGSVQKLLNRLDLPTPQEKRQQLFFNKVVERLVPAMLTSKFSTSQQQDRLVRPKKKGHRLQYYQHDRRLC